MLLALTSAERSSELAAHDLRFRRFYSEGVVFNLPCLTKSIRSGKNLKQSFHASIPENKDLCVVECLREYEVRTKDMRPVIAGQENKLFLSIVQPHKPVSCGTVARWVRCFLQAAGIDTSQFKPHSVRGASASAAARCGVAFLTFWPWPAGRLIPHSDVFTIDLYCALRQVGQSSHFLNNCCL